MFAQLAPLLAFAFAALVAFGALKDAISFTIPNWISLVLIALFPAAALANGVALPAIGLHLVVGVAVLVAGMVMFALRWLGGGDAKLFAAVALWMGWPALTTFLFGAAMAGGFLAIVLLSLRSAALRPLVVLGPPWVNRLATTGEGVPYGVAIAIGTFAALPVSPLTQALGL